MEEYPKIYLYRRIVQAKLFIDKNYAANPELENIADEAYFSKYHFIRLFRSVYGKTPHQYLIHVRIQKAIELLAEGETVSDVCFSIGFESISSFSTLFKKVTGLKPSIYLAQKKEMKSKLFLTPLQFIPGCFAEKSGWKKNSNFQEVTQ